MSDPDLEPHYVVFDGQTLLARGQLKQLLPTLQALEAQGSPAPLIFDEETGRQVDFDLAAEEQRLSAPQARGPGRPKLGVLAREITLLKRHWDWLEQQPLGASATLRRLIDVARKAEPNQEKARRMRAAISAQLTALAGNLPDYEEATRALFASDQKRFERLVRAWPKSLRSYFIQRTREAQELELQS